MTAAARAAEAALVGVHHALDDAFALFRELVLVGDGARAAAVLSAYRTLTARHAADEERALVPLLGPAARWPAELYTGQHSKLLAGLERLAGAIGALRAGAGGWRRHALLVLDTAAPVHHLVEHHHLAEEQDLFVVAAAAQPALLVELAAGWNDEAAGFAALLAEARATLGG